ncbi:beta-ketoacyl-ACP synthase [Lampropedia puyangensis]|uniref:Beta-ketoacyl-ACP synthase n=1 Tax=Lampropedia puyangensis TaxID=1330072 RepID=A0A4S8F591_9BURK|nr:beta-ketoacyl-ACP synthase [Lampropedia puyangensis]THU02588.1 beta-ketoacyl-ACP synthase [Lampropedia puyangensis]
MNTLTYLNHLGITCALGDGVDAVRQSLLSSHTPHSMTCSEAYSAPGQGPLMLGIVHEPLATLTLPAPYQTRCNALLWQAAAPLTTHLDACKARYGADRIAVILGVSTSGLPEGESARRYWNEHACWPDSFDYAQQELGQPAQFLAAHWQLNGPAYTIATACSSGAKALAAGARLLQANLADIVIAGGCDVLSQFTIAGFSALESVSNERCQPLSRNRQGINLGEAASVFLMSREPAANISCAEQLVLAGWGETGDAHHLSAPDPSGQGAIRAMQKALQHAGITGQDIDYINLHGTATQQNDAMEALAVAHVFGSSVPVSSTKPLTGHTLAAAGALEAAFAWLCLRDNPHGRLPPHWWDGQYDQTLPPISPVPPNFQLGRPARYIMSNSFAFGGNNACLILGRGPL